MSRTTQGASFTLAGGKYTIPEAERDRNLFKAGAWPRAAARALGGAWDVRGGHLFRRLHVYDEQEEEGDATPHELWEALLRFPNAPLYATHRKRVPPFAFEDGASWPSFHTMRVLGSGPKPPTRVKHVFLLHNGLNETAELTSFYRLAAGIVAQQRDAVCILRPLPGHLTRFAFHGPYAERPLDVYLRDPAQLFVQFLRHMRETQWLLSALVPRAHYAVMGRGELLAEAEPSRPGSKVTGRADSSELARAMADEWDAGFKPTEAQGPASPTVPLRGRPTLEELTASVVELRRLLGWQPVHSTSPPAEPEPPGIHVVGYSMGGFMAQAAFFAWPFAIASCTNLFAGGAMRDLAPTAFAHPEEWQAVLHGLRFELDDAFRDYLRPVAGWIAGIREHDFDYFTRIFYDVFLQHYRGGSSSRLSELSRRLLFVMGGDDPIARTRNVLDSGPPTGLTLFEIADVGHFPAVRGRGRDGGTLEAERQRFWLPEVGRVIAKFSFGSEGLLSEALAASWRAVHWGGRMSASKGRPLQPLAAAPVLLDSLGFAQELQRLVQRIEPDEGARRRPAGEAEQLGWLLVGRNKVPSVFIGATGYRLHGQAIHHSEQQIVDYVQMMRERARYLKRRARRVSLLIPAGGDRWFWNQKFSSMSEASAAREPSLSERTRMVRAFQGWVDAGVVREVAVGEYEAGGASGDLARLGQLGEIVAAEHETRRLSLTILPDVWIGLSPSVSDWLCGVALAGERAEHERAIVRWATMLATGGQGQLSALQQRIDSGDVLAIAVSAAELNARFRGRRLLHAKDVGAAIVHWALAYMASEPATEAPPMETGL